MRNVWRASAFKMDKWFNSVRSYQRKRLKIGQSYGVFYKKICQKLNLNFIEIAWCFISFTWILFSSFHLVASQESSHSNVLNFHAISNSPWNCMTNTYYAPFKQTNKHSLHSLSAHPIYVIPNTHREIQTHIHTRPFEDDSKKCHVWKVIVWHNFRHVFFTRNKVWTISNPKPKNKIKKIN